MFFDSTMIILIPAVLLAAYAQLKVTSTFGKYSSAYAKSGLTGAEVARRILDSQGVFNVSVESVSGNLTDHYDPKNKTLRLSESVYGSRSISALAVAAHETGHAVQDHLGYMPLRLRAGIYPITHIGSQAAPYLIILGMFIGSQAGTFLIYLGAIGFFVYFLFSLVTLPVEFNASSRALTLLQDEGILDTDETSPAKKVLNAAALTYVAGALTALLNFIRVLMIASNRRDRRR